MKPARDGHNLKSWRRRIHGEPSLCDLLDDPLTHLVMRRDGVNRQGLCDVIAQARLGLGQRRVLDCRSAA